MKTNKTKEQTIINNIIPESIRFVTETEKRDYRKELWMGVCIAVARSEGARKPDIPVEYANKALIGFDSKFSD